AVRQTADALEATLQANVLARQVGHRAIADGTREGVEIRNYSLPHGYLLPTTAYFSSAVMALITADFSIVVRWPTISTLSAPTTLPMKPTRSIEPPAATKGAVTARNASPAPTVSTTLRATAGIVCTGWPPSSVMQPCLPLVTMRREHSTRPCRILRATSSILDTRSLTASLASEASMQM